MPEFAYDQVPYDTEAHADAHPHAMAALGRLFGLAPASPASARVLEIGCGNGENLVAAASYLPRASFVGFDLAKSAIAVGREESPDNVELFCGDILEVKGLGVFDYVIGHGLYSWVPDQVRAALLSLMRDSLAPNGLGFLSANALPGWELRRALRELARDAVREIAAPRERVEGAMKVIAELGSTSGSGFFGALAQAAREYQAYVARTTPPEAPFPRGVFHDLLAECNDAFDVRELEGRLGAAGLRRVCDSPTGEAPPPGTPFLQWVVQRDDGPMPHAQGSAAVADLYLWADLLPIGPGRFRTTTGADVIPPAGSGLMRAAQHAPGFVRVRDLDASELPEQLLQGFREGVFALVVEPPPCTVVPGDKPRVCDHVLRRVRTALDRGAESAVVVNALHRSYRVRRNELEILARLDGHSAVDESDMLARFRRHLLFCEGP